MKRILPLIVAIASVLPSVAHADDKAHAILNEARIRINRATTYDVKLRSENDSPKSRMHFTLARQNNLRTEYLGVGNNGSVALQMPEHDFNYYSKFALFTSKGPDYFPNKNNFLHLSDNIYNLVSLNFLKSIKEPVTITYITQKTLDENTLVDVIEIKEKDTNNWVRLYIDNNSLLRKVVASASGKSATVLLTDIAVDEPVTVAKIAVR